MADRCEVYADRFYRDSALSQAQRYRRRGLDRVSRRMRSILIDQGVEGVSILEVGGGIGALSLELLEAGASRAVNVELSRFYRDAAVALALEANLEDRIEVIVGDGAEAVSGMGTFDVVVMNRVVCCYEDGFALMRVASSAASSVMAVSHPTTHIGSRVVLGMENWFLARRGSSFRAFVHPEETFVDPVRSGLVEVYRKAGAVWTVRAWAADSG